MTNYHFFCNGTTIDLPRSHKKLLRCTQTIIARYQKIVGLDQQISRHNCKIHSGQK